MSYNGSGTFQINTTGQPVVTGTVISSTAFNALTADLATGLSTAITKDGQTATTARIPFAAGISSTLVTDSSSTSTGSIITAGGIGVAKAAYIGTTLNVASTTTLTGVATLTANPVLSAGTANGVTYLNGSKSLTSGSNFVFDGTNVGIGTTAGTTTVSNGLAINNATAANYPGLEIQTAGVTRMYFNANNAASFITSVGTNPLAIYTNSTERMRIDSSGNVLVTNPAGLGYGTGSGGTVTQATSKSTAVTLNKPTGQITMNAAALAVGSRVSFICNNSLVTVNDTVVMNLSGGSVNPDDYLIRARVSAGAITFSVINQGASSLSEAIVFNFTIIKGATS
jgi:hypothetical protein